MAQTLYDKVFYDHVVDQQDDNALIYIDRHLVHEVTSPQAFEGLVGANRPIRRKDLTLATVDHNTPTSSRKDYESVGQFVTQPESRLQCQTLERNVKDFGLVYFGLGDDRQGIVHVIGPEQGFTLPGTTVVCGDSHTSTHGAFGALAFGIGTSEVEHVLATQTLTQKKSKNMLISVNGSLGPGIQSKDVILHIIGVIGTAGGNGHVIEFAGHVIRSMSMEARMSVCNMAIEAGARAGMIAPDNITFEYLKNRPMAPTGETWDRAVAYWQTLSADPNAVYDKTVVINGSDIAPTVTWGTSPQDVVAITGSVPDPESFPNANQRDGAVISLEYMGLAPNTPMESIKIDKAFIGSCTNARIEDLRSAASVVQGRTVAKHVYAMIVPGSGLVKTQAHAEGLDKIFIDAGFDWREAGCSMCLGMNEDQLKPYERCASTSNRNFQGRQGFKGRTHLMSPAMAAAAAIAGHLTDVRTFINAKPDRPTVQLSATDSKSYFSKEKEAPPMVAKRAAGALAANGKVAGMPPFTVLKGVAVPLPMANVDTDKIIPKQFLKTIARTGLARGLFYEMRYDQNGDKISDFVLNKPQYSTGKILISGENFGCGSSREHAPWALNDFGIRCVIAPSFADIFQNNMTKNGMLPVVLPSADVDYFMKQAELCKEIQVDLVNQTVSCFEGSDVSKSVGFDFNPFRKNCLINGIDEIGLTLQKGEAISKFENTRTRNWPWLDGAAYRLPQNAQLASGKSDW